MDSFSHLPGEPPKGVRLTSPPAPLLERPWQVRQSPPRQSTATNVNREQCPTEASAERQVMSCLPQHHCCEQWAPQRKGIFIDCGGMILISNLSIMAPGEVGTNC